MTTANEILSAIRKEIKRRIILYTGLSKETVNPNRIDEDEQLLTFLDTLAVDAPEVDLEKDVESWFFNEISSKINVEHTMYYYFQKCAHRYYELGKKAK